MPSPVPKYSRTIRQATPRECRDCVDNLAEPGLGLFDLLVRPLERRPRAVTLNSDQRHMRRSLDQLEIAGAWTARLRVVHSERTQHLAVLRNEWFGPGCRKPVA